MSVFAIVLVAYFCGIVALGWVGYRRTRTAADFYVAGRTLGALVGGGTLVATQISAGTFVGTVGLHYMAGVCFAWVWPGAWLGWIVSAVFVAPKLRASGALTVPDFFGRRYGSAARTLSAALIVLAYTIFLVAQYKASGIIVEAVLGWPQWTGIALVLASTAVYSLLGGLHGGARIDLLQSFVMVAGVLVAVPALLGHLGGLDGLARQLASVDPRLLGWFYGWRELLAFGAAFGLSLAATPLEITRFIAMRDVATTRYAVGVALVFQAIIGSAIMLIGLSMRALFPDLPSGDLASSVMAAHVLTPAAGALLIAAAFSAIMSTVNALLLVASASVVHDVWAPVSRWLASDRRQLLANRSTIVVLALVPVWFAVHEVPLVQFIVLFQAKLVASFFFAPVVIGLNWRRATSGGALAAMLIGLAVCVAWSLPATAPLGLDAIFPGVAASVAAFLVVSLRTPAAAAGARP
ncbi:MAG: sodium:solute symporter family protein [Betaproteobacteria bacterium]